MPGIEQLLDQLQYVFDEKCLTSVQEVKNGRTVSFNDIRNELWVVLVDFSEFCDAIVAIMPAVSLDVAFDQIAAGLEVLDGRETFEGNLLDLDFGLVVHEEFEFEKIEL